MDILMSSALTGEQSGESGFLSNCSVFNPNATDMAIGGSEHAKREIR